MTETTPSTAGCRLQRINPRFAVTAAGVLNALLGTGFLLGGYIVIALAAQRGLLDQLNGVTTDLGSGTRYTVARLCVLWTLVVVAWVVAMTLIAAVATLVVNRILEHLGGIDLELGEPVARADRARWRPTRSWRDAAHRWREWARRALEPTDMTS